MIKILVYTCLSLVLGGVIIEASRNDQGYVLINYGDVTFASSIWFVVFILLTCLITVRMAFLIGRKLGNTLLASYSWWGTNKVITAERRTHSGFVHFIQGDWEAARRDLLKAAKVVDKPLVHYLAAARSAFELGNKDETQFLLGQAEKVAPENDLAINLSQAKMFLLDDKLEPCLAILQRARANEPDHPVILELLKQVHWQLKDWVSLIDLLPALRAHPKISEAEQNKFENELFESYLTALAERCRKQNMDESLTQNALQKAWENVPKYLKKSTQILRCYAFLMLEVKGDQVVLPLLKNSLNKEWTESLVTIFGRMTLLDVKEQLALGEKWLKDYPSSAELLFALARISRRNELWGKSKEYFQRSIAAKGQAQAYAEYADLLAELGETEKSAELYKKGLLLLTQK